MKIPKYIGYPGKQTRGGYDASDDFDKIYDEIVDDRIVVATIKPGVPEITSKDANVYDFKNAWDKYVADLSDLGIDPPDGSQELNIVISQLSPITRSYQNNYGDSKVLPTGNILGEALSDIIQLAGNNTEEIEAFLKSKEGDTLRSLAGKGVHGYNALINAFRNLVNQVSSKVGDNTTGNLIRTIGNTAADLAKSPQSKIGWPKMWRDCSFSQTYQLNTRLYCFSTDQKEDYDNNIRACVAALELFVTPKSDKGALYTAPYIVDFEIPGMIYFPQAYVSEMSVIEGGNEGDFAQTGRPNVVDITMSIQNMYSISVNVKREGDNQHPYRPSVRKDLIGLATGKNVGKTSPYTSSGSSSEKGENIPFSASKEAQDKSDGARAYAAGQASGRTTASNQQSTSNAALSRTTSGKT